MLHIHGPELVSGDGAVLLTLDASLSQQHEMSATATEHPVEEGADITDHVQPQLPRLTIQGVYSATSLVDDDAVAGRELDAWSTLEQIIDAAVPVTVITTLKTYTNMVLLRVSTARDGRQDIRPTLELRQIRRVDQQTVTLPPEKIKKTAQKKSGPSTQDTGRQPTDDPTTEEKAKGSSSLAINLFELLKGKK